MVWQEFLPEFASITTLIETALDLSNHPYRVDALLSTRSIPRLLIDLTTPLDFLQRSALLSTFLIPSTGYKILETLIQQVPRDRDQLVIGVDGSVGIEFVPHSFSSGFLEIADALGCDLMSPLFLALERWQSTFFGFGCYVSRTGDMSFWVRGQLRQGISPQVWQTFVHDFEVPGGARDVERLQSVTNQTETDVTFGIQFIGENSKKVSWHLSNLVIAGIEPVIGFDASERTIFERASKLSQAQEESLIRGIEICQSKDTRRDISFYVELPGGFDTFVPAGSHVPQIATVSNFNQELIEGIRISLPNESEIQRAQRLTLSDGTTFPRLKVTDGLPYRPEAIVPRLPWRRPNPLEEKILINNSFIAETEPKVAVIRLNPIILKSFEALDLLNIKNLEQVERLRKDPRTKQALLQIADHLSRTYSLMGVQFTCLGISAYQSGQATVSYDHDRHRRVGLHVDTWDSGDIDSRISARNILLINIGSSDRYFLYINISLPQIRSMLVLETIDADWLVDAFMRRFPRYPVIKVRVAPGEAYIAPVQGVIHDGSNADVNSLDLHITYLGYFEPRRL
jgi:hypothetical protein